MLETTCETLEAHHSTDYWSLVDGYEETERMWDERDQVKNGRAGATKKLSKTGREYEETDVGMSFSELKSKMGSVQEAK